MPVAPAVPPDAECRRPTRARWERRIRRFSTAFPVIKDVPWEGCRRTLEIRVYDQPAA